MKTYIIGFVIPLIILAIRNRRNNGKKRRAVPVDVAGDTGYAVRNVRFETPVTSAWSYVTTLVDMFEHQCTDPDNRDRVFLGTREVISRKVETGPDGRSFEKLHLGDYRWLTYAQAYKAVICFSNGLALLNHSQHERAAIFAETRAEWFMALQGCLRRNVTVVTVYASLGEDALLHSLKETEVTTVICGLKELNTLANVHGQIDSVKRVICMDDNIPSDVSSALDNWTVTSFSEVVKLGNEDMVCPSLPLPEDIAVIMYTSGSTGLPKGVMMTHANLIATLSAVISIIPNLGNKDVYLAYLPMAHILELVAEHLIAAAGGAIGYGSPLTLIDTSNKIKKGTKGDATVLMPTVMAAVPAILDRIRDGVINKVDAKGGLSKKLFNLAYARRLQAINGSWFGACCVETFLWNLFVFRRVKAIVGGHIRFILSGGAPLCGDTQRFINICFGSVLPIFLSPFLK